MKLGPIAILVAMLLGAASAHGQDADGDQGRTGRGGDLGPPPPRIERNSGERRPDADRRERRDGAQERARERREPRDGNAAERPRGPGRDIYRRSNNYRRW